MNLWKRIYLNLMEKAQLRGKPSEYCESHHIEPRSVGGSDDANNRVWLTAREHLVAHKLWLRMETDPKRKRKAQNAFWAMITMRGKCNAGRLIPSSREYALAKRAMIEARKGIPRSEETKRKLSIALTKHFALNGSHNKNRSYAHLSQAERDALFGSKNKGRVQPQEERDKRAAKLRKPRSPEARENIRLGALKREAARRAASG